MGREYCCNSYCLQRLDMSKAAKLMKFCLNELAYMSRSEKKTYILLKLNTICWTGEITLKGYYKYNWTIGYGDCTANVCRKSFMIAYDLKHCTLEMLCKRVKDGSKNVDKTSITDKTNGLACESTNNDIFKKIVKYCALSGIKLTVEQLAALQIPNTSVALETYSWLHFFFELVGDTVPNSGDDIHLEPTTIKEVYEEYRVDMVAMKIDTKDIYSVSAFAKMWDSCYPHVKIREYKAVSGKCDTCAHLSHVRKECNDIKRKQEVTYLHALHRSAYMGERLTYSIRRQEAKQFPKQFLSLIADGMAQSHCVLPHLGNITVFPKPLPQHLQGTIILNYFL